MLKEKKKKKGGGGRKQGRHAGPKFQIFNPLTKAKKKKFMVHKLRKIHAAK